MQSSSRQQRVRSIYLLPNLFTTAGLFAGFYAIVVAMKGRFLFAVFAVFIAMLMDSLDGRVARFTNTQSDFGAQYDSLSDMVAFGLAPALVAYSWALYSLGKFGWLSAFIYAAATGLRLARFNSKVEVSSSKRYFCGLPCTSAAGTIISFIWLQQEYHFVGNVAHLLLSFLTILIAVLMVSNIPYRSFKDCDFKTQVSFIVILFIGLLFVFITFAPPEILFTMSFSFSLSGPISFIWSKIYRRFKRSRFNIIRK